jgi:hypothetical protein
VSSVRLLGKLAIHMQRINLFLCYGLRPAQAKKVVKLFLNQQIKYGGWHVPVIPAIWEAVDSRIVV